MTTKVSGAAASSAYRLFQYRELIATLAWKNVVLRYKQAYFGLAWTIAKPLMMMIVFTMIRGFVSIDSGGLPYPVLSFCALMVWTFFQESASDGVGSVVNNAHLIKKISLPREIFPLTAVVTKLVELGMNFAILLALMSWYGMVPGVQAFWVPVLVLYTMLASMSIALVGAAINVYYRDVAQMLPVALNLLMYASPVIYPLPVVQQRLLEQHAAGAWSERLYALYLCNPLAGLIDAFQRVLLRGEAPDAHAMLPGMITVAVLLPVSWSLFKRAEAHFADII